MTTTAAQTNPDTKSLTLGGHSELLVIMPIRGGFVPYRETMTYAQRLRRTLRMLHALRKNGIEAQITDTFAGIIERLETATAFDWAIIDNDSRLVLNVVFDRAWQPYIRSIARDAGPLLDLILCHCEGYSSEFSSDLGYQKFAQWVEKYQVPADFFYAATPFETIVDRAYRRNLEELLDQRRTRPGKVMTQAASSIKRINKARFGKRAKAPLPDEIAYAVSAANPDARSQQVQAVVRAFYVLREMFEGPSRYPDITTGEPKDQWFLKRAARNLIELKSRQVPGRIPLDPDQRAWMADFGTASVAKSSAVARKKQSVANNPATVRSAVQGDILEPYPNITAAKLVLLRLPDSPAQCANALGVLARDVTTAQSLSTVGSLADPVRLNVAFTVGGLRKSGVTTAELASFPREFREGMEERAGLLGDVRVNHPNRWTWPRGFPNGAPKGIAIAPSSVDVLIVLQAGPTAGKGGRRSALARRCESLLKDLRDHGAEVLSVEDVRRNVTEKVVKEHFGFVDGISQPTVRASAVRKRAVHSDVVEPGELVLGFRNRFDDPVTVAPDSILHAGSFLVLRRLRQHVDRFNEVVRENADAHPHLKEEDVKALIVGRYQDGRSLATGKAGNNFNFEHDPDGHTTPLQSHIRLANPRKGKGAPNRVPRIARRGFSYGVQADDTSNVGIFFMAYNASIAEQFEVIQRWLAGANSTRLSSRFNDPLVGLPQPDSERILRCVDENGGTYTLALLDKPLVELEWGAYFFVPSKRALTAFGERLLSNARVTPPAYDDGAIRRLVAQLDGPVPAEHSGQAGHAESAARWKAFLESELGPQGARVNQLWAWIRANGGARRTPYGVLVASEQLVRSVLTDETRFSVRENWFRMEACITETYLGMDKIVLPMQTPCPAAIERSDSQYVQRVGSPARRYDTEARAINGRVRRKSRNSAYADGRKIAANQFKGVSKSDPLDVSLYCGTVLADLATKWFGMPDDKYMKRGMFEPQGKPSSASICPYDFLSVSRYVFPPAPTDALEQIAKGHGARIVRSVSAFVDAARRRPGRMPRGELLEALYRRPNVPNDQIVRTIIIMLNGFLVPTLSNILTILGRWIRDRQLVREYHGYWLTREADRKEYLTARIRDEMFVRPTPSTVNRTAIKSGTLGNSRVNVQPGDLLVVGLPSAANECMAKGLAHANSPQAKNAATKKAAVKQAAMKQAAMDDALRYLFGGWQTTQGSPDAVHECPGREMALGAMTAIVEGLFEKHCVRDGPAFMTLVPETP